MPGPKNPPSMSEEAQEILSERQPSVLERLWGESTDHPGSSHDAPHMSDRALEVLSGLLGNETPGHSDASHDAPHMSEHAKEVLVELIGVHSLDA